MTTFLIFIFTGIALVLFFSFLAYYWPRRPFDFKHKRDVVEYGRKHASHVKNKN